jgi:hypothetical protein
MQAARALPTTSRYIKVCQGCGQTSAQVLFSRLSQTACTSCDSGRKQARNLRISERGPRVVMVSTVVVTLNPKHLAWIRCQPCAVEGLFCGGIIHAHHVRTAANSGTAMLPPDDETVPLCAIHHAEFHRAGAQTFQDAYDVDLKRVARDLRALSPHAGISA